MAAGHRGAAPALTTSSPPYPSGDEGQLAWWNLWCDETSPVRVSPDRSGSCWEPGRAVGCTRLSTGVGLSEQTFDEALLHHLSQVVLLASEVQTRRSAQRSKIHN